MFGITKKFISRAKYRDAHRHKYEKTSKSTVKVRIILSLFPSDLFNVNDLITFCNWFTGMINWHYKVKLQSKTGLTNNINLSMSCIGKRLSTKRFKCLK